MARSVGLQIAAAVAVAISVTFSLQANSVSASALRPVSFVLDGNVWNSGVSSDGRFAVFASNATNLVNQHFKHACYGGHANGDFGPDVFAICPHVFVRDLLRRRTSVVAKGTNPLISSDGRIIAYETGDSGMPGDNRMCSGRGFRGPISFNCTDVFVRDRLSRRTERVSLLPRHEQPSRNSSLTWMSDDGRLIAFVVGDIDEEQQLYLRDRRRGTTVFITRNADRASFSPDGRYVTYVGYDAGLVAKEGREFALDRRDVILLDRATGKRTLASKAINGAAPNGPSYRTPSVSADGGVVVFSSSASNLVPGNPHPYPGDKQQSDVYEFRKDTGVVSLVSRALHGGFAHGSSSGGRVTPDGRLATFFSSADDLVLHDPSFSGIAGSNLSTPDVFVADLPRGKIIRVTTPLHGQRDPERTGCCDDDPMISPDGATVIYEAESGVFVKNLRTGSVQLASPAVAPPSTHLFVIVRSSIRRWLIVLAAVLIAVLSVGVYGVWIGPLRRRWPSRRRTQQVL